MNELTYHDIKEEQELANKLIELDKAVLVRKIINKNRLLDEYAKEINELQEECEFGVVLDETLIETNKDLQQRINKAIEYIEKDKKNIDSCGTYVETYKGWKLIPQILEDLLEILKGDK